MGRQKIIKNIEGVPCIDLKNATFIGDMKDTGQEVKSLLIGLYEKDMPVSGLLYPDVPFDEIVYVLKLVCPRHSSHYYTCYEERYLYEQAPNPSYFDQYQRVKGPSVMDLGLWHILHADFSKCENPSLRRNYACFALRYGIDLFEEFDDPFALPFYIWESIVLIAMHNNCAHKENVCRFIKKDMSLEETLGFTISHIDFYIKPTGHLHTDVRDISANGNPYAGTLYSELIHWMQTSPKGYNFTQRLYWDEAPTTGETFYCENAELLNREKRPD